MIKQSFTPFNDRFINFKYLGLIWFAIIFGIWFLIGITADHMVFPRISHVLEGLFSLYKDGLVTHVVSSLSLFVKALGVSIVISLFFAYLSLIPFFSPLVKLLSKLRYLPLAGITFYISMLLTGARSIQVAILVMFTSIYLITSLMSVFNSIDEKEINHARTLGCSRWEILLEVVIKGRVDYVLESIRQNLSIIWMMLVTVESLLASAGGLGFLIKNSDKFFNQGKIVALQLVILLIAFGCDILIEKVRKFAFRYTF